MADRKCSCCGQFYTDEGGHDLEKCIKDCARRVDWSVETLTNAATCSRRAKARLEDSKAKL